MHRRDIAKVLLASSAVSPLMAQRAYAQTCNAPCFPLTPAEILHAAPVTEAGYAYLPGAVQRYGVIGDGVQDDTAALQAAADFCQVSGTPILGFEGTCTVTATINLNCIGDLAALTIRADTATVSPVVRVGTTAGNPTLLNGSLRLPKIVNSAKSGTGWPTLGTGLELANVYQAELYVPHVYGFFIGMFCGGHTSGFCYNTVHLGMISTNKIGLRIQGRTAAGWANQNTFIGGRFFIPGNEGTGIVGSRYIQLTPLNLAVVDNTWPNGNTFIGCTIESGEPEYLLEVAGNNNTFLNCRFEAAPANVAMLGHASALMTYENMIIGGYNSSSLTLTQSGLTAHNGILNPRSSLGFALGNGPTMLTGTGSPQGTVAAPVGSLYLRSDGGAGTTLYVKQSGASSSTGWVGK